jgi:hypothetical protein
MPAQDARSVARVFSPRAGKVPAARRENTRAKRFRVRRGARIADRGVDPVITGELSEERCFGSQ